MIVLKAKIGRIDMHAFQGRDHHPEPSDSGTEVEVMGIELCRFNPDPVDDFDLITARTADGRVIELVEFEVETISGSVVPATMNPTITHLKRDEYPNGQTRDEYLIEGGTLRADWREALGEGKPGRCHVSIWSTPEPWVGSYGGTVWPTAWPELFQALPPAAHGPTLRITPAGLAALEIARVTGSAQWKAPRASARR